MDIDPFVAQSLNESVKPLVPTGCKEGGEGPTFSGDVTSERSIYYSCDDGESSNAVCMRCPFLRGREMSI